MKRWLLALLFVPLLSRVAQQPGTSQPQTPLASFPLDADPAPSRASALESVIVVPLGDHPDAFAMTAPDRGVAFDLDGDGVRERIPWTEAGAEVAFLALDVDGDGAITSGRELFGGRTLPGVTNGCNALIRTFEAGEELRSGSIHEGHRLYEQLLLWVDRNHDGRSQPDELRPARASFTAIGLGYTGHWGWDAHGNRVRWEGWAQRRTAGPEQGIADDPLEERARRTHYYEVLLAAR
jgi:hypothetical protein